VSQPESNRKWDPGIKSVVRDDRGALVLRNDKIFSSIASAATSEAANGSMIDDAKEPARTELDSHANMPVVGRNAYVLAESGKTVDVSPFTPTTGRWRSRW